MNKSTCITYVVGDGLYVNLTNACSNQCEFCIRNNGDGAYGSDSLWLKEEPSEEAALADIFSHDFGKYSELVFCGYGEPSYRLAAAARIARAVKERHPDMRIRINTNGQSDLILGCDTSAMYEGAFDVVSVSLNAPNAARYDAICHSVFGASAFDAIIAFVERVKKCVPETVLTVVGDFLTDREREECKLLAGRLGVPLRVRSYIGP